MPSDNELTRRDFATRASGALSVLGALGARTPLAAQTGTAAVAGEAPLDLAEWSFFWVGVERAEIPRGTVINGKQMYVEYQIPAASGILIPSCWCTAAAAKARIGCVRPTAAQAGPRCWCRKATRCTLSIAPAMAARLSIRISMARFRNRTSRSIRSRQCSRRSAPSVPIRAASDLRSSTISGRARAKSARRTWRSWSHRRVDRMSASIELTHTAWRERGAELLDKIGPAIIMTHSAGGPFGYLVAEVRPNLVKGIVVVEGAGAPFGQGPQSSRWGITTIPMTYDPPVKDPSELKSKEMPAPETRRRGVPDPGRARSQAEKPAGHSDCAGHL